MYCLDTSLCLVVECSRGFTWDLFCSASARACLSLASAYCDRLVHQCSLLSSSSCCCSFETEARKAGVIRESITGCITQALPERAAECICHEPAWSGTVRTVHWYSTSIWTLFEFENIIWIRDSTYLNSSNGHLSQITKCILTLTRTLVHITYSFILCFSRWL